MWPSGNFVSFRSIFVIMINLEYHFDSSPQVNFHLYSKFIITSQSVEEQQQAHQFLTCKSPLSDIFRSTAYTTSQRRVKLIGLNIGQLFFGFLFIAITMFVVYQKFLLIIFYIISYQMISVLNSSNLNGVIQPKFSFLHVCRLTFYLC